MILIAVHASDGREIRCDDRCYNGQGPKPRPCICGGINYGAGLEQARDNSGQLAGSWIERARVDGLDVVRVEFDVTVLCEPLFTARELVA
jgi:hypothetical protein